MAGPSSLRLDALFGPHAEHDDEHARGRDRDDVRDREDSDHPDREAGAHDDDKDSDKDEDREEGTALAHQKLIAGKPAKARSETPAKAKASAAPARASSTRSIAAAIEMYAPVVYLAQGESHGPSSASAYIANSRLRWSHDSGVKDENIADQGKIDSTKLGDGKYTGQVTNAFGKRGGDKIQSNQDVRPKDGSGVGGDEGFFLDLNNDQRDARAPSKAPVYHEAKDGHYITYWFFYAYNDGPAPGGIDNHEGDWERICVRLNPSNIATEVAFFQHNGNKDLRWNQVDKEGKTHPIVYSAKGSHASYESAGAKDLELDVKGKKVPAPVDDHASKGTRWNTSENLQDARQQSWYGYGGAWGEVGNSKDTTGPSGPSHKSPAPDGW